MTEKVVIGECELWHGDCLDVLPLLERVDLLLTDPPYGINACRRQSTSSNWVDYGCAGWDNERPSAAAFELMIEKSKEGIIWGGNYFSDLLPPRMKWLVWDKQRRNMSMADCELAWTSQSSAARVFTMTTQEARKDGIEHATQKPLRLMHWCLGMHPKAVTVLDPFMGSGTTGVACVQSGRRFVGIEKERRFFEIACRRIEQALAQIPLLPLSPIGDLCQADLSFHDRP